MAEGLINNKTLIIQGILAEKCGLTPDLHDGLADLLDDIRILSDAKDSALAILSNENSGLNIPVVSDCTMTAHPTLGWVKEVRLYECPTCLNKNLPELATYCPDCGGKFDWERYNR